MNNSTLTTEATLDFKRRATEFSARFAILVQQILTPDILEFLESHPDLPGIAGKILSVGGVSQRMRVLKALRHIEVNFADPRLDLAEAAKSAGVSHYYLCKSFRRATGKSFVEHLNEKRIDAAKVKLQDRSLRIKEVAYSIGYRSLSNFNRIFLRLTGQSPTRYRKSMKSQAKS